jgi:transcription elongation factor Elf1
MSDEFIQLQDIIDMGFCCPMCGGKKLRTCYHDHQLMDSNICETCGIRWREDIPYPKRDSFKNWEKWVKDALDARKNQPAKYGIYKGILAAGGFVWVLHKTGDRQPVLDHRSSDSTKYNEFGYFQSMEMGKITKIPSIIMLMTLEEAYLQGFGDAIRKNNSLGPCPMFTYKESK